VSAPNELLDTNIFVSARNRGEAGHLACRRLPDRVDDGQLHAIVSTITIAEKREGPRPAEAQSVWQAFVSHILTSPNYAVEPVDRSIAEVGGELRERTKLELPDALIVATAKLKGAEYIVTQDAVLGPARSIVKVRSPTDFEWAALLRLCAIGLAHGSELACCRARGGRKAC
jgi:predicted nucleic acid-binding protein